MSTDSITKATGQIDLKTFKIQGKIYSHFCKATPSMIGKIAENLAAEFLEENHYQVVRRNWRNKIGEIDILAIQDKTLIVIEVKSRREDSAHTVKEAVSPAKLSQLYQLARIFIYENRETLRKCSVRFDVIRIPYSLQDGFILSYSIEHIQNVIKHGTSHFIPKKKHLWG